MQTLRIFISSPGDVAEERQIAGKVIERLQGKYWSFVRLDDVFWEQKVIRSTAHYQDELVNPGECEMVVGILWSRLGSLMPEKFRKASGERYHSGTEWELEMAFDAYEKSLASSTDPSAAKPDIVIYRRDLAPPQFEDPGEQAQAEAQVSRLEAYFRENYWFADGTIKRPITRYTTLDEFELILSRNLEELILRQIPSLKAGFEPPPISGSPFKGLQAFDFTDSDRYFGRNREIREIQQRLIAGAGKGLPFVLIYGGSGYGKSSLMRAGLAPVITRPGGSSDEIQGWRRVYFQPAKGDGTLCERFTRALLQIPTSEESEHCRLRDHWPLSGLAEITGLPQVPAWDIASLTRHFSDGEMRAHAVAAVVQTLESLNRHLLLEIDQLEEIFTMAGVDPVQRANLLSTIGDLCLSGRVWAIATMRSEFFPRIAAESALRDLVGRDRGYILPPPDRQSLREIIRYPALAARLGFERRIQEIQIAGELARHDYLDDQILADAECSPDALPLLEFTLQQLYDDRNGMLLTWAAYAKAGGLKGAIAQRATAVYQSLSQAGQESRHRIFAALVHIDPARGTITRQRAPLAALKISAASEAFLQAFLAAHLLVTDEDALTQQPVITLAHEALISHWDELSVWIKNHQGDLLARQRLREQTDLWLQNGRKKTYLLSEARLAEAERVSERDLFTLAADEDEFLKLSKQRSRKKTRILKAAVTVFALLAVAAAGFGAVAKLQSDRAERGEKQALQLSGDLEVQLGETLKQLDRARFEEGKGWLERARAAEQQGDTTSAVLLAARAVGFLGYGREQMDEEWQSGHPLLLAEEIKTDPELERQRKLEHHASERFIAERWLKPVPLWISPAGSPDDEVECIAFSPDSTRIVAGTVGGTVRLWDLATGKSRDLKGHGERVVEVAFSPDGTRIASASYDHTVRLWDADRGVEAAVLKGHQAYLGGLAFTPDGSVLASGDIDGVVKFWDMKGMKEKAALPEKIGAAVSLSFSPDGKWLLCGCESQDPGEKMISLWDMASLKEICGTGSQSFSSVAFSPQHGYIVGGSWDRNVRSWEIWNRPDVEPVQFGDEEVLGNHPSMITQVIFDPGGNLVTASDDAVMKLHIRNYRRWVDLGRLGHRMAFSPDHSLMATIWEGSVVLWEGFEGNTLRRMAGNGDGDKVDGISFRPKSENQIGEDGITVWESGKLPDYDVITRAESAQQGTATSPDGKHMAKGAESAPLEIWNIGTNEREAVWKADSRGINSLAYSPDGVSLASGSQDHHIRIWKVADQTVVKVLEGHQDRINAISYHPGGGILASASSDGTVRIWDLVEGRLRYAFPDEESAKTNRGAYGPEKVATCVAFSPSGKLLAAGDRHGVVRVWNVADGAELASFVGHVRGIASVAFSPEGDWLVSNDGEKLRIWRVGDHTGFAFERTDLLQLQRAGLFQVDEGKLKRITSTALSSNDHPAAPLRFPSAHLAALATQGISKEQAALQRVRLLSQGAQWRAAIPWRKSLDMDGFSAESREQILTRYVNLLLDGANDLAATGTKEDPAALLSEIAENLTPERLSDSGVSQAATRLSHWLEEEFWLHGEAGKKIRNLVAAKVQAQAVPETGMQAALRHLELARQEIAKAKEAMANDNSADAELHYASAVRHFAQATRLHQNPADFRRKLVVALQQFGDVLVTRKKRPEANEVFTEFLRLARMRYQEDPDGPYALDDLGVAYARNYFDREGGSPLSGNLELLRECVEVFTKLAKKDEESQWFRRALIESKLTLGTLLTKNKDFAEVGPMLEQCISLSAEWMKLRPRTVLPQFLWISSWYQQGELYAAMGEVENARASYEQALKGLQAYEADQPLPPESKAGMMKVITDAIDKLKK